MTSISVKGIPASVGVAIGPVWIFKPVEFSVPRIENCDPQVQWQRIEAALAASDAQLQVLYQHTLDTIGAQEAEIFEAHQMVLSDPDLIELLKSILAEQRVNAEAAIQEGIEKYANLLLNLEGEYFKARAQDLRDIGRRILRNLLGLPVDQDVFTSAPAIIVAEDLAPSDTVQFERKNILGFCIVKGGPTSHTAILARSIGVPAVVSAPVDIHKIANGDIVIVNGTDGVVVVDPSEQELKAARLLQQQQKSAFNKILALASQPAVTLDQVRIEVVANIGGVNDAVQAVQNGAEGVGLLRTEFLYLERQDMPSEEEQVTTYRAIFEAMGKLPIIVRTMDIGGDKQVSYLGIQAEPNPFLGWRAIRMINERPDILKDQLRAILQAGAGFDIRIMIPMISCLEEVLQAKDLYLEARQELTAQGRPCAEQVQFGIMIEVPSAAMIAKTLAKHVDFFSIGTNDLTQYTTAVDRTNERVIHLASYFHPAVLQLIARTIEAAHANHKWVGLCGEMAGDPLAIPFLLGIGLDEFSMAAQSIPVVKQILRGLSVQECAKIAAQALELPTTAAVIELLKASAPPALD
jgi:phosphoenolpyruvate-protein phosphotransferase